MVSCPVWVGSTYSTLIGEPISRHLSVRELAWVPCEEEHNGRQSIRAIPPFLKLNHSLTRISIEAWGYGDRVQKKKQFRTEIFFEKLGEDNSPP